MENEDILKIINNNEELKLKINIIAMLNVIIQAMIIHGWFTEEEFNKIAEETKNNLIQHEINDFKKKEV